MKVLISFPEQKEIAMTSVDVTQQTLRRLYPTETKLN